MVIVTKLVPTNGEFVQEHVATHKTQQFRRIVRKYCNDWDCRESVPCMREQAIILRPNNGADWRLHVEWRS